MARYADQFKTRLEQLLQSPAKSDWHWLLEEQYGLSTVMRVVGSSLRFRNEPHGPQLDRLTQMFRRAVRVAESYGIRMAVENHIDFNGQEILSLLRSVDSPFLGMNFDTGNFVRVLMIRYRPWTRSHRTRTRLTSKIEWVPENLRCTRHQRGG